MFRFRFILPGLISVLVSGCVSVTTPDMPETAKVELLVIGDTPYDAADEAMLKQAIPAIKALHLPFILHVGDMQASRTVCGPADDRFATLWSDLAPTPMIYTPGDNGWSDCNKFNDPAMGTKFSELGRLDILRKRFFSRPALSERDYDYVQQDPMPENARFEYKGLIFITLNISGTNNARDLVMGDDLRVAAKAAERRDADTITWLKKAFSTARREHAKAVVVVMQADMTHLPNKAVGIACHDAIIDETRLCDGYLEVRSSLLQEARAFKKPVFLIHGDTFPFTLSQGIFSGDADNLWQLNAAGDVGVNKDGSLHGVRDVTHVWIDLASPTPIRAEGLLTGEKPVTSGKSR